jgi:hypothetical protein
MAAQAGRLCYAVADKPPHPSFYQSLHRRNRGGVFYRKTLDGKVGPSLKVAIGRPISASFTAGRLLSRAIGFLAAVFFRVDFRVLPDGSVTSRGMKVMPR